MHSIWSRAFGYEDELGLYHRAMVPVINAANHHHDAADSLSEIMGLDVTSSPGEVSDSSGSETLPKYVSAGKGSRLLVRAGRDYAASEQFFIVYGKYPNAKLLYRF
ncbi:unnamed protein product, partial [Choristocarpus tenellus]